MQAASIVRLLLWYNPTPTMSQKAARMVPKSPAKKPKEPADNTHMAHRYTVGYNPSEFGLVRKVIDSKSPGMPVGLWIRLASLKVARQEAAALGSDGTEDDSR